MTVTDKCGDGHDWQHLSCTRVVPARRDDLATCFALPLRSETLGDARIGSGVWQ